MTDIDIIRADKLDALLVKEMDETNNWARLGAQLYYGWFTLLLTVNGFATGWLFTNKGNAPGFAWLVFIIFIALNLMGAIATFRIRTHLFESDRRIANVIETLTQRYATEGSWSGPRSPVPLKAINTAFGFTGVALVLLALFWTTLAILNHRREL